MKLYNKLKNKLGVIALVALLFQITMPVYQGYVYATEGDGVEQTTNLKNQVSTEGKESDADHVNMEPTEGQAEDDDKDVDANDEKQYDDEDGNQESDEGKEQVDQDDRLADMTEGKITVNTEGTENNNLSRDPKEITDNIIDNFKLTDKDGNEFEPGDLINVEDDLRFDMEWSLPNEKKFVSGDTFTFDLPKQLKMYNAVSGNLPEENGVSYGTFDVTDEGKVTLTFNEEVENKTNINGTLWVETKLEKTQIESSTEILEIILNDEQKKSITINIKPWAGQKVSKGAKAVGGTYNTEEIEWTVLINTNRESLTDAVITDPISDGQKLMTESIKLEEVEVSPEGEVQSATDLTLTDFENTIAEKKLIITLGDTNKAYRLTFKTKILESEKEKQGETPYTNKVYLTSEGKKYAEDDASVTITRPKSLEKEAGPFVKEDRSITWTVKANFNQKQLKKDEEIVDEFTFTIDGEDRNDIFKIIEDDIEIKKIDKFEDDGTYKEENTSNAKSMFDIAINNSSDKDTKSTVTYKLNQSTSDAFIITYKTQAKDGKIIDKDGKIVNKVTLDGKTIPKSRNVKQQVGKKTASEINYEDKTIDWTITINADNQELKNFILTDDFSGSGQKLVDGSIDIKPDNSDATVKPNADNDGFEINFGNITDKYVITYQTEFTYDFTGEKRPEFKNGVKISYKTENGPEYNLEFEKPVDPNNETKSNGVKKGKVDEENQLIEWTVDINYNQLSLTDAKLIDTIEANQLLVEDSVEIYKTTIEPGGKIVPKEKPVESDRFLVEINKVKLEGEEQERDQILINFGEITQSYRIKFKTKDRDDVYNPGEVYKNTVQFIPREGEEHQLTDTKKFKHQGKFLDKKGVHNKKDWQIDWTIMVNESKSTLKEATIEDDLGDINEQILLKDTIEVRKVGSETPLVENQDYQLTFTEDNKNKFKIKILKDIEDTYKITYSSYILASSSINQIENDAKISSVGDYKITPVVKNDQVEVRISTGGGTGSGDAFHGGLMIKKTEADSNRVLEGREFILIRTIGTEEIEVRKEETNADGEITWTGLGYGDYTLKETPQEGYEINEDIEITIGAEDELGNAYPEGLQTLPIVNTRKTGIAKIIKEDLGSSDRLEGVKFELTNQTTGQSYEFTTNNEGVIEREVPFGKYTVVEKKAPNGYRAMKDENGNHKKYDLTVSVGDEPTNESTITVKNMKLIDIKGQKTWHVDEGTTLPDKLTLKLLANGEEVADRKKEISESDDWKYTFEDLDKYDEEGKEIVYEVDEVLPDGYILEKDGNNLINIQTINIPVTKTWSGGSPSSRPDFITIHLFANGEKVGESVEVKEDEDKEWKHTFKDLPKYDVDGEEIVYTVDEDNVPGYSKTIDGFNIINTRRSYIPPTTIDIAGTKYWKDNDALDRPKTITVNLLRNNVIFKSQEITAVGDWKFSFPNLRKYDPQGKAYDYQISEEDIDGYKATIDGTDIINTRSEKTSIDINKIWLDNDSENRPDSVTVHVYQNEELFETVEVKAADDWIYALAEIEAYDEEGQAYIYTIEEESVEGYTSSIERNKNSFDITNTIDEEDPEDPEEPTEPENPEPEDPEDPEDPEEDEEGKVEGEGPEDGEEPSPGTDGESPEDPKDENGSSKGDGPGQPGQSDGRDDEDRLPQTGEANNTLLYVIGTLFILVGLGLGRKKFEQ